MALEPSVAATWLFSRLTGNAALTALVGTRISDWPAPQGQVGPYVVYQMQTGIPISVVGGIRIFSELTYLVWAGMQTRSYGGTLGQAAEAIDVALENQSGTALGGSIFGCELIEHRHQVDPDELSWRFYGGLFRISVQR